jgi:hypothetical protein
VQVHHDEGVATHIGPKPCVDTREGVREASAGECAGQPWSCERKSSRVPTTFPVRKARRWGALSQAPCRPGVVVEPGMYRRSSHGNREISSSAARNSNGVVRIGKARSRSR